jgi:tRNA(Ile)-lysidine synthetase-like protein
VSRHALNGHAAKIKCRIVIMDIAKTIKIAPGHYVVAVSGGVDSIVLLDILAKLTQPSTNNSKPLKLTVAHFDHGIRPDSHQDLKLVKNLAKSYGLPFVYDKGLLGADVSEEKARDARYIFLRKVQKQSKASGIITAHHMNDVIETATHNLLRGTGRRGMSSLKSVDGIIRPLLHLPKQHLIDYARANNLEWREDSTNLDMRYRRNYIRHELLPYLQATYPEKYELLKAYIKRQASLNEAIDIGLCNLLHVQPSTNKIRRYDVITLPHNLARDLVGEWIRQNGMREFNSKNLERATIAIKVAQPNTLVELSKTHRISIGRKHAQLLQR